MNSLTFFLKIHKGADQSKIVCCNVFENIVIEHGGNSTKLGLQNNRAGWKFASVVEKKSEKPKRACLFIREFRVLLANKMLEFLPSSFKGCH